MLLGEPKKHISEHICRDQYITFTDRPKLQAYDKNNESGREKGNKNNAMHNPNKIILNNV